MIRNPENSGSLYFNYKKYFIIIFLAVCNANYEFTITDIGETGRQNDASVFVNSLLGQAITKNKLSKTATRKLTGSDSYFPYVLIGDDASPLPTNLVKPYINSNRDIQMGQSSPEWTK